MNDYDFFMFVKFVLFVFVLVSCFLQRHVRRPAWYKAGVISYLSGLILWCLFFTASLTSWLGLRSSLERIYGVVHLLTQCAVLASIPLFVVAYLRQPNDQRPNRAAVSAFCSLRS